ncbi:unnamed protein product [Amoebophrya sp. A25]|nr:unnamed protein product [Amoebophrya sp. A25]|eukprot:GSA25T00006442001.1
MFLRDGWAKSPYMNDSHEAFCKGIRAFINEDLLPDTAEAEVSGEYPTKEIYQKMGQAGLLAARIGPACMPVVKKLGIKLPGGVSPDDFDYFHEMLAHEAIGRLYKVSPGYVDGLGAGFCIGLPPVLYFAKKELQKQVVPEVLLGNKRICLAISEPIAGSDVANIETTAKKSECGKYYILNGVKKWITNGMFADYFVTAVRTGGKGMKGISMICVPREGAGGTVTTKPIPTSYSPAAGTALVMFDDFKVPVECLLDKEGGGFKVIMANFNHERWWICAAMTGCMRECVKDCQLWSSQREVFGKKLIKEPVIRQKLAKLMVAVESQGAHIESLTHQMKEMDYFTQAMKLAGPIALLKFNTTRLLTMMSDEAVQIFGGRGITRGGMGAGVEKLQKTFKFSSILGGSEEIMADLGVRQAMREMPQSARL